MIGSDTARGARIVDRGYQHYDGERQGATAAVRAIALGTMRRSLGFKRPGSAKILPFLLVIAAYLPFIVVVGLRLLIGDRVARNLAPDQLWPYERYFGWLGLSILLLAALAAPEALCPDRRQRVLSLYYASPVRPLLYLLGQAIAVTAVLLLVAMLPPLMLWVANVGLAADPAAYLKDHAWQAPRIIAGGATLALFDAMLGLAIASFTERKGYAAGALIGGAVVASVVAGIVSNSVTSSGAKYATLINPFALPANSARWFLQAAMEKNVPGLAYFAVTVAVTIACAALTVRSYRKLEF